MINWTEEALKSARDDLIHIGDVTLDDIRDALNSALYEQMRMQGEISITTGMSGFYDAGYDRAIESCANALEAWEIEVGVSKDARGRLPQLVRQLKK
jgi:hypothetical protein